MNRIRLRPAWAAAMAAAFLLLGSQALCQTVTASCNAGLSGQVRVSVTSTGTGGQTASGSIHVQTTGGVIDANYSALSMWTTSKGVSFCTGTALGYYQANSGGSLEATSVSVVFSAAPGMAGTVSVTLSDYYSHQVYFQSGACNVIQGHVTISP